MSTLPHSIAYVSVWHADITLVGTTFSRSHMTCFQSIGNAKPNGEPAYSLHSTCSWFNSKTFWEWIHQRWCVSVYVSVCVRCSLNVDMCVCTCHNDYVCTMPASSAHIHQSSELQCNTHVLSVPSQIAAYPPILPQPQSRTSRQQTGTLHLLEKPEARYHSTPCSQYITVYHNVAQCAGSLIGALWPFGGRFY